MKLSIALAMGAALLGAAAMGAKLEAQTPAPPQSRPVALVGGTIHTVSNGVVENGTIVFDQGRITALGQNIVVPADAERIDVSGKHIYPGLIDAHNRMGLWEIGDVRVTIDLDENGDFNPNVRAHVAFNAETRHLGVARSNGVLVTVSSPTGGLVSGLASAMMLDGWTWEELTLRPEVGMIVNWPQPFDQQQYQAGLRRLRDHFAAARAYHVARAANPERHPMDVRLAAMIPVLERRMPVIVQANDLQQIQDAVNWAEQEAVDMVLLGGSDAGYVTELLARRRIPVILTGLLAMPNRLSEPYDSRYSLPARLHRAGVPFAIAGTGNAAYTSRLPYEAGVAMAFGLPAEEAIRAVTLYPAQLLGFADRVGSLEIGKDATLIIATGNPLEYSTRVEQAYIEGRRIDMMDSHRQFFEKYMERVQQSGVAPD